MYAKGTIMKNKNTRPTKVGLWSWLFGHGWSGAGGTA